MLKAFEMKYKLEAYEVVIPMFDLNGCVRDVLQIGSVIKHITIVEEYWADCKDELELRSCFHQAHSGASKNIWYQSQC